MTQENERDRTLDGDFLDAVELGNLRDVKLYIGESGSDDVDVPDHRGWTPLTLAAYYGHTEIVVWLLALGATPDFKDLNGMTPLDHATAGQHKACIDALSP
ncbi:ankyrin repeat domain-containing protein [bacterium AH-315-F18]|nr:ankyrin repeat domain-containing protein [bacterium AH-315-F18]